MDLRRAVDLMLDDLFDLRVLLVAVPLGVFFRLPEAQRQNSLGFRVRYQHDLIHKPRLGFQRAQHSLVDGVAQLLCFSWLRSHLNNSCEHGMGSFRETKGLCSLGKKSSPRILRQEAANRLLSYTGQSGGSIPGRLSNSAPCALPNRFTETLSTSDCTPRMPPFHCAGCAGPSPRIASWPVATPCARAPVPPAPSVDRHARAKASSGPPVPLIPRR